MTSKSSPTCCELVARETMSELLNNYLASTNTPDPVIVRNLDPNTCNPESLEYFVKYCEDFPTILTRDYELDYNELLNNNEIKFTRKITKR